MSIRLATIHDLPEIVSIYNEFIDTTVTMDTIPATIESKTMWFENHSPMYPLICSVNDKGVITGWGSLSKWSEKQGYRFTVEISVYVSKKFHSAGIGTVLVKDLIIKAKELKYHCIVSRIDSENKISLSLHKKFGFIKIGKMREFGFKYNRYIDIDLLQLLV